MFREKIIGKKMALVVVDPQRKFSLDSPDWESTRNAAVSGMNRYTALFRRYGFPIIFVRYIGKSSMKYEGTDGDDWLPGIECKDTDIIVDKHHMSCFVDTELERILRDRGADSVLFIGMLTEYCVASTYFSASERRFFSYTGRGALIPYSPEGNRAAEVMLSTVDEKVVERFLSGEQPYYDGGDM